MATKLRTQFAYGTLILLGVAAPLWWIGLKLSKESDLGVYSMMIGGFIAFVALITFWAYAIYCIYDFIEFCITQIKRRFLGH